MGFLTLHAAAGGLACFFGLGWVSGEDRLRGRVDGILRLKGVGSSWGAKNKSGLNGIFQRRSILL